MYSIAISSELHTMAVQHLLRAEGQEDLCFATWCPSQGMNRKTALLHRLILPKRGERRIHGNASFTARYFERALAIALADKAGLALMHSHLTPGWQRMSKDDVAAENGHAASVKGATSYPLVGLTIGTDGAWSARFWEKTGPKTYERRWCHSVRVVGGRLRVTYNDNLVPATEFKSELLRTISAWGEAEQSHLARLRVGITGTGSVGSIVAESIARMGVAHIRLLDFDIVENVNLGCLLHARLADATKLRPKVEVLAEALRQSATAQHFIVDPLQLSVVEERGFRAALDCDVLFSCVDRPWARFVLNFIAYAHLIPVVDGGLLVQAKKDLRGLMRANWRSHVVAPSRKCLECLNQYDPGLVSVERDGYLNDPNYIKSLPDEHPLKRNENVFGLSLATASSEVLQFLRMVVDSPGLPNPGAWSTNFVTANTDVDSGTCGKNCLFPTLIAKGDSAPFVVTGAHPVAEKMRTRLNK